jgi:hypothetical protein
VTADDADAVGCVVGGSAAYGEKPATVAVQDYADVDDYWTQLARQVLTDRAAAGGSD